MTIHYLKEFIEAMLSEEVTGPKANRIEFLKKKIEPIWANLPGHPGLPEYHDLDKWLEKIAEADPTQKGIYIPWIATLAVKNPAENKMEDIGRVSEDLAVFDANKAKVEKKDINQYKSFQDLYTVIAKFLEPKKLTKDEIKSAKEQEKLNKIKSEITTVYNGPEGWIRVPKTEEAAKFLGQNTRWCTASSNYNRFEYYHKDDALFVIYDKSLKARFQLHIDSGQFADEADLNKKIDTVPEWAWEPIIEWYKANNPNLSIKHLMTLGPRSKENLAAGTVHEDLLSLFKQYNI